MDCYLNVCLQKTRVLDLSPNTGMPAIGVA